MTTFFKKNETTFQLLLSCSSSFNVLAFLLPPFSFYFQEISLYNELTIQEMLYFFGSVHGMTKSDIKHRTAFLLDFLKLPRHPTPIQQLRQGRISVLYRYCNFCKCFNLLFYLYIILFHSQIDLCLQPQLSFLYN